MSASYSSVLYMQKRKALQKPYRFIGEILEIQTKSLVRFSRERTQDMLPDKHRNVLRRYLSQSLLGNVKNVKTTLESVKTILNDVLIHV